MSDALHYYVSLYIIGCPPIEIRHLIFLDEITNASG